MNISTSSIIQFDLPNRLACPKPTEERRISRDQVRLLMTTGRGEAVHTTFNHLNTFLEKGDVLVVNTSATIPAALPVSLPGGNSGRLHVSTKINDHEWLVEIRKISGNKTIRWKEGREGMIFQLPKKAQATLKKRFYTNQQWLDLWAIDFTAHQSMHEYLAENGRPVQYEKLDQQYPLSYYQTFFSYHPGSSEMPSAGRGFTNELIESLLKKGITIAPILLHTGISSLEENELPYPEYMEIDPISASVINTAKSEGHRIIAAGTTAVRAIETAAVDDAIIAPYRGNTDLFIDDTYAMKIVDGLLTGFHEPRASHLNMLQSLAGYEHINNAYQVAIKESYYWHQFGDLHLIMP